jgi:RNA polymerase sigma-70 factor (ECF subfamily)
MDDETAMRPDIEQLARAHGRAVFHAAYRVLGDAALAEDVQQPPRTDVDHWGGYLTAMATRAAIDEIRRRQRWQRIAERFRVLPREAEPLPQEILDGAARADRLRRALARLPRRQAECFALRFFDGCSLEAIAASVSVSLNRATRALKQRIDAFESTLAAESPASESTESSDRDSSASQDKETPQ